MNIIYRVITDISGMRPSYGTLLLVIFVIASLVLAFKLGKGGVLRNIIGVYIAIVVCSFLPFLNFEFQGIKLPNIPFLNVGILIVFLLVISYFLSNSSLGILDKGKSNLTSNFILSVLGMGLLFSTISIMLPDFVKNELTGTAHFIFVNETARFFWGIAPVIGFVFLG